MIFSTHFANSFNKKNDCTSEIIEPSKSRWRINSKMPEAPFKISKGIQAHKNDYKLAVEFLHIRYPYLLLMKISHKTNGRAYVTTHHLCTAIFTRGLHMNWCLLTRSIPGFVGPCSTKGVTNCPLSKVANFSDFLSLSHPWRHYDAIIEKNETISFQLAILTMFKFLLDKTL